MCWPWLAMPWDGWTIFRVPGSHLEAAAFWEGPHCSLHQVWRGTKGLLDFWVNWEPPSGPPGAGLETPTGIMERIFPWKPHAASVTGGHAGWSLLQLSLDPPESRIFSSNNSTACLVGQNKSLVGLNLLKQDSERTVAVSLMSVSSLDEHTYGVQLLHLVPNPPLKNVY